jgi:hypothetical protein
MVKNFQVIADFKFSGCRPMLVGLSLHSTSAACTTIPAPASLSRFTSISRIFKTLREAKSYINHLQGRYPNCPISFPVLDKEQNLLFEEQSK